MEARLVFWTAALANMALVVLFAVRGVRAARSGDIPRHRSSMLLACGLVVAFLLAYAAKRVLMGGEDLSVWSPAARWNLWVHEGLVTGMLLAGGFALAVARGFAGTRRITGHPQDPPADPRRLARHRRAGRIALGCALLGFLTACGVWASLLTTR